MINRKLALRIKVKHLAEEAKIIRKEEHRTNGDTRNWLHIHRVHNVRHECRATQLAYAFAKGTPLEALERYPTEIPKSVWKRVKTMVKLYADRSNEEFVNWVGSSMTER